MRENPVLKTLRCGDTAFGTFIFEFATTTIARLAATAGADFFVLDQEHSSHTPEAIRNVIAASRGVPIVPIVRVSGLDRHAIASALDLGALGIMVPMVGTADEAESAVSFAKYPPDGTRGFGILFTDEHHGDFAGYMRIANHETALIVQIESAAGIENIDAIAAVPGVDVLWVGQYDLTASLGIPGQFEHPSFQAALDRVVAASERHGKAAAMSSDSTSDLRGLADRGFRCLAYGHDVVVYERALATGIAEVRGGPAG